MAHTHWYADTNQRCRGHIAHAVRSILPHSDTHTHSDTPTQSDSIRHAHSDTRHAQTDAYYNDDRDPAEPDDADDYHGTNQHDTTDLHALSDCHGSRYSHAVSDCHGSRYSHAVSHSHSLPDGGTKTDPHRRGRNEVHLPN